ncbi:MAG TPA: hypothetical protein RMH99_10960 [Sandaracinaceae bacterium LLY-WYZ-13_1]|nr:hypothetical protein [Sandaracinaceae bacterium LLY-WYZ-13_1]
MGDPLATPQRRNPPPNRPRLRSRTRFLFAGQDPEPAEAATLPFAQLHVEIEAVAMLTKLGR